MFTPVRVRSNLCLAAADTRREGDVVTSARRSIMLLVLLVSLTGRASSSAGVRFECFDDLCVSRLQYCSDSQQRCQYCRKEHCLDPAFTPARCQPLCSELLNTSPPEESTASSYRISSTSRLPDRQHGAAISTESLLIVTTVLFILVIVLLIVILVLATFLCNYSIPVYKHFIRQRTLIREANMLEENETLLKETHQKRNPGETKVQDFVNKNGKVHSPPQLLCSV